MSDQRAEGVATLVPTRKSPASASSAVLWTGLAVVLAAAAVLSFFGLRELAISVRIEAPLAWLLPIAVDAGAAVSCATWLSRGGAADTRRFACWLTWALLTLTVVGNAAQLGMHANGVTPPWWVAVLVGAVPPTVVGGVVHLAVLVGRGRPATHPGEAGEQPGDGLEAKVRALVATTDQPVGRGTVMKELGVTEHQARKLLATVTTNGAVTR